MRTDPLRTAFLGMCRTGHRVVDVAPWGDDEGSGREDDPYATIDHAAAVAEPGDLIRVADGTYGYTHVRDYRGDENHWLVIMPKSDPGAVRVWAPAPSDNAFNVTGSSFVGIFGLEVCGDQDNVNTNGSGISIYGESHHVCVWRCHVHDFPGGGVNCFDVDGSHDVVDVSFNRIHGTSKYSPSNTSAISIHGSADLANDATWDGRHANRIVGNYIYDVECRVPFAIGGYDVVTDGNGISIDDLLERHGYEKPTIVAGNLVVGCGGRAVHLHNSRNALVVHNTGVGTMGTDSPAIRGFPALDGDTDESNRFRCNLVCSLERVTNVDRRSSFFNNLELTGPLGLACFQGEVTWEGLPFGLSVAAFRPTSPQPGEIVGGFSRLEVLGAGYRPSGSQLWAVGALEA